MIRPSFPRYLTMIICVFCAICLVVAVIAVMRGDTANALASQKKGLAQGPQEPFMVKDINPSGDSDPQVLTNFDNELFFAAADGDYGVGLWQSDGTITGTTLISGVVAGGWSGAYQGMVQFKDRLYFDSGHRIWMSDGTPQGTQPLTPQLTREIEGLIATRDRLTFFTTERGCTSICWDNGLEMWVSDGSINGTVNLGMISGVASGFSAHNLVRIDNIIYFSAYAADQGVELWRSDGTLAGTYMVKDIAPGYNLGSDPFELTVVYSSLFFGANLHELWKSDGTMTGTVHLKDIVPSGYGEITELEKSGKNLFVGGGDVGIGFGIWVSDGTEDGTVMLRQYDDWGIPYHLKDVDGTLFFTVNTSGHLAGLWKSDGTVDGTVMIKDFLTGVGGSNPLELRAVAGKLYFSADDGVHGFEPWVSDGTEAGTLLLADIEPGAESSNPADFSYSNGKMFFSAWDQVHGRELWGLDIQLIPRSFLPYIIAVGNDSDQQQ